MMQTSKLRIVEKAWLTWQAPVTCKRHRVGSIFLCGNKSLSFAYKKPWMRMLMGLMAIPHLSI
jgi:hypothetical protein